MALTAGGSKVVILLLLIYFVLLLSLCVCVCVCFVSGLFSSVLWLRNNLAEKEMADYVVLALM